MGEGWPSEAVVRPRSGPGPGSVPDDEVEDGEAGDPEREEDQGEEEGEDGPGQCGELEIYSVRDGLTWSDI